jgi:recombinational DNA repair protein (RecF pathway)
MLELVGSFIVFVFFVIAGVGIMVIGLGACQPFSQCSDCKKPMPDGFWAYLDGEGHICRECGRRRKILPWYAKTLPNGKVLGKDWED